MDSEGQLGHPLWSAPEHRVHFRNKAKGTPDNGLSEPTIVAIACWARAERPKSDAHHVYKTGQLSEVLEVAGIEGEVSRASSGRDQQVHSSSSPRLPSRSSDGRINTPTGTCSLTIERQGVERGLSALQPVLASGALACVDGCMGAGCEFCHGDGTHRQLSGELGGVESFEIDDY